MVCSPVCADSLCFPMPFLLHGWPCNHHTILVNRRKFRSETSDNMDSWNSRGGKSQRGEEKKREDQRGEK